MTDDMVVIRDTLRSRYLDVIRRRKENVRAVELAKMDNMRADAEAADIRAAARLFGIPMSYISGGDEK